MALISEVSYFAFIVFLPVFVDHHYINTLGLSLKVGEFSSLYSWLMDNSGATCNSQF